MVYFQAACSKKVVVILLNGQKMDVMCDPNTVTAGQVFEVRMFVSFIKVKRCWYHCVQNKEFNSAGLMRFRSLSDRILKICASKKLVVKVSVSYFNTCTVHILLFRTMTHKCAIISQIITLLHISTLSCHPQAACNKYLAKLHKYVKCSCW